MGGRAISERSNDNNRQVNFGDDENNVNWITSTMCLQINYQKISQNVRGISSSFAYFRILVAFQKFSGENMLAERNIRLKET